MSALAVSDGETKALIMAADLLYLKNEESKKCREYIAAFCDIPEDAIFLTCSHTHTGPVVGVATATGETSTPEYEAFMYNQMRDAAYLALNDLKETEFSVGTGEAKNQAFIRRFRMKDGSVRTNPGVGNPDILEALGAPTDTVKLIKMERKEADDIYLVKFGNHPDAVGGEYIVPTGRVLCARHSKKR